MTAQELQIELRKIANPEKAVIYQRFFKTSPGGYGEGDIFIGLTGPQQAEITKKYYKDLNLQQLQILLDSEIHEDRTAALLILVNQFKKASIVDQEKIVKFYLKNTKNINNWDLVDCSAYKILGLWLLDKDKSILDKLVVSKSLWERRIAMVTTLAFIRVNNLETTFKLAEKLLSDQQDLMHKATGWMLREAGKRDIKALENFLNNYIKQMPRTMLRYAIEKFPEEQRLAFLKK